MWRDLEQAFKPLEQEDALRCIVVRGAGGNFAAGADLSEFPALRATADQAEAYGQADDRGADRNPRLPASDHRGDRGTVRRRRAGDRADVRPAGWARADSRFGIPIQKVGVAMPYPELAILTQMLGRPTMLALLLEGQLHDAAWAERHGLLTRIATDLEADLSAAIGRILGGSPVSHRHHKHFTRRACRRAAGARCRRCPALLRGGGNGGLPGGNSRFPRPSNSEVSRQLSAKYLESLSFDSSGLDEAATRG